MAKTSSWFIDPKEIYHGTIDKVKKYTYLGQKVSIRKGEERDVSGISGVIWTAYA